MHVNLIAEILSENDIEYQQDYLTSEKLTPVHGGISQ